MDPSELAWVVGLGLAGNWVLVQVLQAQPEQGEEERAPEREEEIEEYLFRNDQPR